MSSSYKSTSYARHDLSAFAFKFVSFYHENKLNLNSWLIHKKDGRKYKSVICYKTKTKLREQRIYKFIILSWKFESNDNRYNFHVLQGGSLVSIQNCFIQYIYMHILISKDNQTTIVKSTSVTKEAISAWITVKISGLIINLICFDL